jgi:phosphoribosylformylglycinamidine synthase PurS subunit
MNERVEKFNDALTRKTTPAKIFLCRLLPVAAQIFFNSKNCSRARGFFRKIFFARMKAKIIITPKKAVVDPQGLTVLKALEHMGHQNIKAVHVGKFLEIELDGDDRETARKSLDEACHKFLSNPVIEDYKLEIE